MDEQAWNRVIEILETTPHFFVPVRDMWRMLRDEGTLPADLDLYTFYSRLAADERFEMIEGIDSNGELGENLSLLAEAMGGLGGPQVKLASRLMTADDVFEGLRQSLRQLREALLGAWETRPETDAETDSQLLQAISAAEQLEQEVIEMIEGRQRHDDAAGEGPTA
jgi:Asp-tRNA(Asn)/Glu-tRNA(Gln) amidotransferase A subunit family amidase